MEKMKRLLFGIIIICSLSITTDVLADAEFSKELLLAETDPSHAIHPRVCTGPNNAIYIVWTDQDGDGVDSVFFTRSLDGGSSFEEKREIEKATAKNVFISAPEIGVDSQGTISIVYSIYDYENSRFALILRKSEDDGSGFDTQTIITRHIDGIVSGQNTVSFGSDIKITDKGIYYVWSGYREIFLVRSINGDSHVKIIEIEAGQAPIDEFPIKIKIWPSFAIDSNKNIYVVWYEAHIEEGTGQALFDLYSAKLENEQETFKESRMIAKCDSFAGFVVQPSIAVTSNDTLFVTWYKAPSSFDNLTSAASYTMSSNDGGATFSEPIEITFGRDESAQNRKMIVDRNEVLHFLYILHSNGMLHYTKSYDSCNSFDQSLQIGTLSGMADMHLDEKKANVYVVWEDPQKSGVYFSRSVEETDGNDPSGDTPGSRGGDGGSSGCFIHSVLDWPNRNDQVSENSLTRLRPLRLDW
jgi:hypothetical protein